MSSHRTVRGVAEAEIVEKRSRFIAHLAHVDSEEEAIEFLNRIRSENAQARHNVYAYILSNGRARYSDDGEPAQTSGIVTHDVLKHADLSDVICVTTRYFGGVLLGTGGLARAYADACNAAINVAAIETVVTCVDINVTVSYPQYQTVVAMTGDDVKVESSNFTDVVDLTIRTSAINADKIVARLIDETNGQAKIQISEPFEGVL